MRTFLQGRAGRRLTRGVDSDRKFVGVREKDAEVEREATAGWRQGKMFWRKIIWIYFLMLGKK